MNLSSRLQALADLAGFSSTVADIGTDHGYIPVYLIINNIADKVIASDVSNDSLNKARELVLKYGLTDRIQCRLGNGLDVLSPGEVDTIIIAGMGGNLMAEILTNGIVTAKSARDLILQPMNRQGDLRKWLLLNGFEIADEDLVKEDGRFYEIIKAAPYEAACEMESKAGKLINKYMEDDFDIGYKLIEKGHPLLKEFIFKKMQEIEKIITKLNIGESFLAEKRYQSLQKKLEHYKELYKWIAQ